MRKFFLLLAFVSGLAFGQSDVSTPSVQTASPVLTPSSSIGTDDTLVFVRVLGSKAVIKP